MPVTTLFLDIGGVLLTNGWDRTARHRAAHAFHLDHDEMGERHHLTFDTYEEGKLSLDDYLNRVIFYRDRSFTREEFRAFMFEQSQPYLDMIHLIRQLKARYHLKTVAVSNEGRELTLHRIQTFQLGEFIDFFISSCFVHYRKPDLDIYRVALDTAQVSPENVAYIDDREMFIEVAQGIGIRGLVHIDVETTRRELKSLGLSME